MKLTRKLALLLVVLTLIAAIPFSAFAAEEIPLATSASASFGGSASASFGGSASASFGGTTVATTTEDEAVPAAAPATATATATVAAAPSAVSSKYSQYLRSTTEMTFSDGDSVSKKAADLCENKKSDKDKVLAIYNYIAANFTYDTDFANKVISGQIRTYTPNTASILKNKKGVCYDFSALFAAMCRSQGIPAKLCKGYSTRISGYHAWNTVYIADSDAWYTIDLTFPCYNRTGKVKSFSKATVSSSNYTVRTAA